MTMTSTDAAGAILPGRSHVHLKVMLILMSMIPLLLTGTAARAQEATPISAGTSPTPGAGCGERLGIGDGTVACLTFVHASSDAGSVDISIDGRVLFSGVGFDSSTGFVAVPAATYAISISAAGQPDTILIEDSGLDLAAGVGVEFAIAGSRDASTLQSLVLPIAPAAPPAGSVSLRVVQTIPDAPPLDIGLAGGDTLIGNLAPLTASGYLSSPATSTSIEVRAAGSADVLFPVPTFPVPSGATITIYALGTVTNPTGISLLTVLVPGAGQPVAGTPVATPAA